MKVYIIRGKSESIPGIFHVINSCGAQELIIKSVTIRDFWCDFSESSRLMATHCMYCLAACFLGLGRLFATLGCSTRTYSVTPAGWP
jgi:hypothetical protein